MFRSKQQEITPKRPGIWLGVALLAVAAILSYTNLVSAQQPSTPSSLSAPSLTAQATEGVVALSWTTVSDATRYDLWVWDSINGWQQLGGGTLTSTTFTHSGVTSETTYYYTIRAVTTTGVTSAWSDYVNVTVPVPPLSAPSPAVPELTAQVTDSGVELSWTNVSNAVSYDLWVWTSADDWQQLGGDTLTDTSYTHQDVTSGTAYYTVRSVNAEGATSAWAQNVSVTMPQEQQKPQHTDTPTATATPTSTQAITKGETSPLTVTIIPSYDYVEGSIVVTWDPPASGSVSHYILTRTHSDQGVEKTKSVTIEGTLTFYTDHDVEFEFSYDYVVTAYINAPTATHTPTAANTPEPTTTVTATPTVLFAKLRAAYEDGSVVLTWTFPGNDVSHFTLSRQHQSSGPDWTVTLDSTVNKHTDHSVQAGVLYSYNLQVYVNGKPYTRAFVAFRPSLLTVTPTATSTPTAPAIATETATSTPTDSAVATETATSTPTAPAIATVTATSTPTDSAVATETATSTPTAPAIATVTATSTPTNPTAPTATATAITLSAPTLSAQVTENSVDLSWTIVTHAARYELWVWDATNEWRQIGGNSLTGTSYEHTGVVAGTTYHYTVRAISASGVEGAWSGYVTVTIRAQTPPLPVTTATSTVTAAATATSTVTAAATATSTATPVATLGATATATPTMAVSSSTDRATLVALYNATDGPNWWNNTNWLSDKPIEEWFGVTTNSDGRVTRLNLKHNNLDGTIPSALSRLSQLTFLALVEWNDLTGSIPSSLGNLSRLTHLELSGDLTGSIPSSLGNLSNLKTLDLCGNSLTGSIPSGLRNLSNLTTLCLASNDLTGSIPSWLGNLSQLQALRLGANGNSASRPGFSGTIPSSLGNLSKLKTLSLGQNSLSGSIPTALGRMTKLENLWLYRNNLSGSIPSSIGNLSNLKSMDLMENDLTGSIPTSLGNLSKLEAFILKFNNLTGSVPSSLSGMTNLKRARLYGNNFTGGCIPTEWKSFYFELWSQSLTTGLSHCDGSPVRRK